MLIIAASIWAIKAKQYRLLLYPALSLILISNSFILRHFLKFPGLIFYEQDSFADRLSDLAIYASIPLLLLALQQFVEKILLRKSKILKAAWILIGAGVLTASLYISYPRVDNFVSSHGWSVGAADTHGVEFIHADAKGEPYVVLANQSVSAAAIREFGFSTRYPIPTSSPLYSLYLAMVYENPSAARVAQAMNSQGVRLGYFVINSYWWQSKQIVEEAKKEADHWESIDNGKVTVFRYVR